MEILTAIMLGIVGGILVKALFLKDSSILWDAVFGVIGGLVAYAVATNTTADIARYVATTGTAVVVAGVLHEIWRRFGKTA